MMMAESRSWGIKARDSRFGSHVGGLGLEDER